MPNLNGHIEGFPGGRVARDGHVMAMACATKRAGEIQSDRRPLG
ncbi:MAG: hypothetical protein PHU85_17615 [Phycisphaerae bacterium]|nr:hypothetical protein [Phycisphaerae bacterium]